MMTHLFGLGLGLRVEPVGVLGGGTVLFAVELVGVLAEDNEPAPELLLAGADGGVLDVALEVLEAAGEVVLVAAEGVPAVAEDLDAGGERGAALGEGGGAAAGGQGADLGLELVALQDGVEAAVDLVQARVELGDGAHLRLEAVGQRLVARAQHRHEARRRLVLQRLLPLARVLVCRRLVKGNVRLVDLVVKVVLEDAVGVGRVPLLGDELDLVQDGLLVCVLSVSLSLTPSASPSPGRATYEASPCQATTASSTAGPATATGWASAAPSASAPASRPP